ncbi:Sporulation-specific N-acetylmuramoyl-L-alanine amidase [Bacillus sp. THAF10]|nr:Sporulation-specific N-acetylmuramoyl-L-alanine amidase [Bacillus sp. THAF10]
MKIVLDAGHGYQTPGKRTPDGMKEYEFNRVVATYAREELLQFPDVDVMFTHSDKLDVPLQQRTSRANQSQVDAFVSIHANAFGNGGWNSAHGIETYTPLVESPNSNKLAALVHQKLIKKTGRKDRGIKSADFHVLRETKMASILCECGFMTNMEEAQLLKTDRYRKICGVAIAEGVAEYFQLKREHIPKAAKRLYKVQVGAFHTKENAERLAQELQQKGYPTFIQF